MSDDDLIRRVDAARAVCCWCDDGDPIDPRTQRHHLCGDMDCTGSGCMTPPQECVARELRDLPAYPGAAEALRLAEVLDANDHEVGVCGTVFGAAEDAALDAYRAAKEAAVSEPSEWAREKALELLPGAVCQCAVYRSRGAIGDEETCGVCEIALALDAARAEGATEMRERLQRYERAVAGLRAHRGRDALVWWEGEDGECRQVRDLDVLDAEADAIRRLP